MNFDCNRREKICRQLSVFAQLIVIFAVLIFSLLPVNPVFASTDFKTVDSETYRLFNQQKWDSVILIGKSALRENIDYFYLRLRIGISYFEIKKYILAIEHLGKAHEFNSIDPIAMEYLYESYILAGRNADARYLADKMPAMLKEKLQPGLNLLDNVHLEGGYTFSSDDKGVDNPSLMGNDSIYGEQDLYGNHSYMNLDLTVYLTSRISLTFAYNYLNFSKIKYFQYGYYQDQLDSTTNFWWGYLNHYSWNKKVSSYQAKYNIHQHELYLGSTFQLPGGIKLMPALHLIYSSSEEPMSLYSEKTIYDTIYADTITPDTAVYSFQQANYSFLQNKNRSINYLFSFMITKDFSVFTSGLACSFSNLNKMKQTQLSWSLTYYPWGRTNFYANSTFMSVFQEGKSELIFQQVVGGKILSGLWLEGSAIIGDLTNANLMNGFIVYNNTDKINYRLGATFVYSLTKNLDLSIIYQYFSNKSIHLYYTTDPGDQSQPVRPITENNKYQTNTIIGGVTWKF